MTLDVCVCVQEVACADFTQSFTWMCDVDRSSSQLMYSNSNATVLVQMILQTNTIEPLDVSKFSSRHVSSRSFFSLWIDRRPDKIHRHHEEKFVRNI